MVMFHSYVKLPEDNLPDISPFQEKHPGSMQRRPSTRWDTRSHHRFSRNTLRWLWPAPGMRPASETRKPKGSDQRGTLGLWENRWNIDEYYSNEY